jgi:hypothetical protein
MDEKQTTINWPRVVKSGIVWLRNDLSVARGYCRMVGRAEAGTELQAKCIEETQRYLARVNDTINRLNMLVRWSETPVRAGQVSAVELLPLVREVIASLPVGDLESPCQVRTEAMDQIVLANREDLKLLIDKITRCVRDAVQPATATIWVREPSVGSLAEHWIVVAATDQLEPASDLDNLVPFTDDRAASFYALDTRSHSARFRQVVAACSVSGRRSRAPSLPSRGLDKRPQYEAVARPRKMERHAESLFEDYLLSLGRSFSCEPAIGTRPPRYLVHSPVGDLRCVVKDFQLKTEDREEVLAAAAALPDTPPYGLHDLHHIFYAQYQIYAASRHLCELDDPCPCVVVLSPVTHDVGDSTVLRAMHGIAMFGFPTRESADQHLSATALKHESRFFTRTTNTVVSAVAVPEVTRPKAGPFQAALADYMREKPTREAMLRFVHEFCERHPEVREEVPRLRVFINEFAERPLQRAALNGPHDLWLPATQQTAERP